MPGGGASGPSVRLLHVLYYGTGNDVIVMHDGVHCTAIASSEKGGISRLILNIE